jgi:hypothetical protein
MRVESQPCQTRRLSRTLTPRQAFVFDRGEMRRRDTPSVGVGGGSGEVGDPSPHDSNLRPQRSGWRLMLRVWDQTMNHRRLSLLSVVCWLCLPATSGRGCPISPALTWRTIALTTLRRGVEKRWTEPPYDAVSRLDWLYLMVNRKQPQFGPAVATRSSDRASAGGCQPCRTSYCRRESGSTESHRRRVPRALRQGATRAV